MPIPTRICIHCGETFELTANKPGKVNECKDCAFETHLPLVAKVSYANGKASGVQIEITADTRDAARYNGAQRHHWSRAY